MNPYYAMAAIFGLGLRGIEQKMKLPYGPLGSDGVTRATIKHLPTSLEAAVDTFKREGSVAREVFGDYFVDHFAGTRDHELEEHRKAVTSWEGELAPPPSVHASLTCSGTISGAHMIRLQDQRCRG